MGPPVDAADLTIQLKYKLLRALNVIKRLRGQAAPLEFDDVLFLAAQEHAAEVCNGATSGSIGADGKTLPLERVAKWGRATGLEDYVLTGVDGELSAVMDLIVDGQTKNLVNGHLKRAAIATCPNSEASAVVVYLAENVVGNAKAAAHIDKLKSARTPINVEAEARIVQLKEELLGLVAQERSARLVGDSVKEAAMARAIGITVSKIKAEEQKLVESRMAAENAKKQAKLDAQAVNAIMQKIQVAQGELAVVVANKQRLQRAKEILMMRSGQDMNSAEELDFKRSIDSFVELVAKSSAEVAAAQKVVDALVAEKNKLLGAPEKAAEPEPVAAPAAPKAPEPEAPALDGPFEKLLPDTLKELPSTTANKASESSFDAMVPSSISGPAGEAAPAGDAGLDVFADLLPDGLKALENEGAAKPNASALPEEIVDENDVTEDILEDQEDFDFNEITAGVPGADELLNGGRRLQAGEVSDLLFGSANLAL